MITSTTMIIRLKDSIKREALLDPGLPGHEPQPAAIAAV